MNYVRSANEQDPRKLSKPNSEDVKEEVDFFADMTPDIPKKDSDLDRIQQQISSQKVTSGIINVFRFMK